MGSVWVEGQKVNSVPYRLFVMKTRNKVVAAIVFSDDRNFYLTYSKAIAGVVKELILPSPFVDANKSRDLVFRIGKRVVKATGYQVVSQTRYGLDLLTEEVRYLLTSVLNVSVRVRKTKSEERIEDFSKSLSRDEKVIYELAPIDVSPDLAEVMEREEVFAEKHKKKDGSEENDE